MAGFFDNVVPNVESFSGGNFFENLFADVVNAGVQGSTFGLAGYENGRVSNGVTTNWYKVLGKEAVSGLKDVTGAKAAEEANLEARKQFEKSQADADLARSQAQAATARDQMTQSRMANRGRGSVGGFNINPVAPNNSTLGGEKDFLGL